MTCPVNSGLKSQLKQAQLAGDGTYPWVEKFHGKNLLNQKRIKNDKTRKYDLKSSFSREGEGKKMGF